MARHLISKLRILWAVIAIPGVRVGRRVFVSGRFVVLGNNFINDDCRLLDVTIGRHTYFSPQSIVVNSTIGNYCSIGPGVKIGLGVHPLVRMSTSPFLYNDTIFSKKRAEDFDPVIIGHDVWIGANALLLGGIKVGNGAIIGAGSVVTRDIPRFAIVVGVPAKVVRYRFDENMQNAISESSWWDLPPERARLIEAKLGILGANTN